MPGQVKVRVRCVVDIPVGAWSETSTMNELKSIAKREGLEKLQNLVKTVQGAVYGQPKVVYVMIEEE